MLSHRSRWKRNEFQCTKCMRSVFYENWTTIDKWIKVFFLCSSCSSFLPNTFSKILRPFPRKFSTTVLKKYSAHFHRNIKIWSLSVYFHRRGLRTRLTLELYSSVSTEHQAPIDIYSAYFNRDSKAKWFFFSITTFRPFPSEFDSWHYHTSLFSSTHLTMWMTAPLSSSSLSTFSISLIGCCSDSVCCG